ncbi:VIR protein [Plasmodium vivax]|uniref:VIR protein n=1 Tax=Plasmodium vivax TaxID=5855 RepID=A0A1G4E8E3_PLAVI|nr:VIR protein [Plasmodium vivax]
MSLSLDDLAKIEVYKGNAKYEKLFHELDNACNEEKDDNYCKDSYQHSKINKSFIPQLRKIFYILKRTKLQNDIYIKGMNLGSYDPCLYYKYWFYYKIINSNLKTDDIEVLMYIWNENIRGIYRNIWEKWCKFYAKSLDDVKIMKLLYDHIFIFKDENNNPNLIEKIKKCEFCNHLKEYIKQIFGDKTITCSDLSPYAICMEYNNHLKEFFKLDEINNLSCEGSENDSHYPSQVNSHEQVIEEGKTNMEDGATELQISEKNSPAITQPEKAQNNNLSTNNTIIGTSILGVSSFLFLLYKFTSLGSLIRRRKKGINGVMKKYQEGNTDVLLLQNSEGTNINYDNNQYNLAYTPV